MFLKIVGMFVIGLPIGFVRWLRWQWRYLTRRLPYIDVPGPKR